MSGSNCCDPERVFVFLRKPGGSFAARREVRFELPGLEPGFRLFMRGLTRPHLVDWDRDGHADLVVGYPGKWTLYVAAGPLAGKEEVKVRPVTLPAAGNPVYFAFADWDGDGKLDVLAAVQSPGGTDGAWVYGIDWLRNTAAAGEPKFAPPVRLLNLPADWELHALAVSGRPGRTDLAVSVSRKPEGVGDRGERGLWLYRQKGVR